MCFHSITFEYILDRNHGSRHSKKAQSAPLTEAIRAIERGLRAISPGTGGIPEGEDGPFEWRALEGWAASVGLIVSSKERPDFSETGEHGVTYRADEGVWIKYTKPWRAGFTVILSDAMPMLCSASPLEYLRRLALQNDLFSDDVRLVGIQYNAGSQCIVTQQPHVPGRAPKMDEMHDALVGDYGFQQLNIPPMGYYKSKSYIRDDLGLFDAHPANFVKTRDGTIVPIDVILVRFAPAEAAILNGLT